MVSRGQRIDPGSNIALGSFDLGRRQDYTTQFEVFRSNSLSQFYSHNRHYEKLFDSLEEQQYYNLEILILVDEIQ